MIFISHSSKDASTAAEICDLLEQNGIECFVAPRDIRSGREYAEEIVNGIDGSHAMVLLMSGAANASPHVLREVERAVSKNIPLLVYKLEEVELSRSLEYFLMTHQWIDQEKTDDYVKILEAVKELEQNTASPLRTADGSRKAGKDGQNGAGVQKTAAGLPKPQKGTRRWRTAFVVCAVLAAAVVFLCFTAAGILSPGREADTAESYPVQVGDTLVFGSYNDEPIQWRVLRLEEQDGRQTAVLVSRYILTMKAFDTAESGKYNHDETKDYISAESEADHDMELQAYVRGNSSWQSSNIRTWLNAETELVAYEGQAPVSSAMSELHNGYQNEPGFLYQFSQEELEMLVERECHTPGNALEEGDIVTLDRVFLLSEDELVWFDQAGISKLSEPTQAALDQDMSQWYEIFVAECGLKEYAWWLRTPVEGYSSKAYLVENGYGMENEEISNNLKKANVGLEGFGVRPAATIDLERYFEYQDP
ncbi:MAG: toll/interleukin-1 receptor domain-containing protein [Firmicutes bacterium]|nr:toll/interleukin-1 receptor domain-containing protein [Bacillota bacterium]